MQQLRTSRSVQRMLALLKPPWRSRACSTAAASGCSTYFGNSTTAPSTDEIRSKGLPLLSRLPEFGDRIFLSERPMHSDNNIDVEQKESVDVVTFQEVIDRSLVISSFLKSQGKTSNSPNRFVAQLTVPGWEYVSTLWGCWDAGYGNVPLALTQKVTDLEHVLSDTEPGFILLGGGTETGSSRNQTVPPPNEELLIEAANNVNLSDRLVRISDIFKADASLPPLTTFNSDKSHSMDTPALVLYTSGTTGRPKGVVSTHRNVFHQVTDLVSSWEWSRDDVALHCLPLHHVHGVINILSCAAYVGARLDFQTFDAKRLWEEWGSCSDEKVRQTVLMAVPTIYAKLLEAAENLPPEMIQEALNRTLYDMRLMVSGSAALPVSVLERWKKLTGHVLLERYGMTEFAMALSNPYDVKYTKHPGHVGQPLPSVEVKIVDEETGTTILEPNKSGGLRVRGPTVFAKYLNRPEATKEAFDDEGYFDTGDIAEYNSELKSYRILGRASVDILKVGGHKLSALDIERVLLEHPSIAEVAIMGVVDETWGERVGMMCRLNRDSESLTLEAIRQWCSDRLEKHAIPSRLLVMDEIPKNAMQKINKKALAKCFDA